MSMELKNTLAKDNDGETERKDNAIKSGSISRGRKPIVLSSQRFSKIMNNAKARDQAKALAELEEKERYAEKLKEGSEKLVSQFKGNMPRTQEQKLQQIKEQRENKTKQGIANYEHAKENEAQQRQEKIAKAKQIMERLKPGPRELQSAVLQSEVLRARNVQRTINEEFEKAVKKQEYENRKMCTEQAVNWIAEEQQRQNERLMNNNAYKKELLQTINDNQKQRSEQKKQMIKEEQASREAKDMEIKAQIEKEKAIMEKKKEALRNNALVAMKMVEQRRLRDRVVEGFEDRLCCVYNAGKNKLDALRNEQTKKLVDEHQRKIDVEVTKLNNLQENSNALESDRIRRDITTMQLKFTAEEQEKVRKDKAAKQARIEAYLKEMQEKKEMQRTREEEKRFDIAQRLKNDEVNCLFAEKQKEQNLRQFQKVRSQLNQQIEGNKKLQYAQRQAELSCFDPTVDEEHNYFFNYARNLMEDAQQKGRPLYPFVKVVNQYKRENKINCDRKIPRHLESNFPIGDKNTKITLTDEKKEKDSQNSTSENILQNCVKINEILKAANDTKDEKTSGEISKRDNIKDACVSNKYRYSVDELKKMDQFSAPTCY